MIQKINSSKVIITSEHTIIDTMKSVELEKKMPPLYHPWSKYVIHPSPVLLTPPHICSQRQLSNVYAYHGWWLSSPSLPLYGEQKHCTCSYHQSTPIMDQRAKGSKYSWEVFSHCARTYLRGNYDCIVHELLSNSLGISGGWSIFTQTFQVTRGKRIFSSQASFE